VLIREFDLGDILTIVTGKTVNRNRDVKSVRALAAFMVHSRGLMHIMPSTIRACRTEILKQHPSLGTVTLPTKQDYASLQSWLTAQEAVFGAKLRICQMQPQPGQE
jgi:hypothetical protein